MLAGGFGTISEMSKRKSGMHAFEKDSLQRSRKKAIHLLARITGEKIFNFRCNFLL